MSLKWVVWFRTRESAEKAAKEAGLVEYRIRHYDRRRDVGVLLPSGWQEKYEVWHGEQTSKINQETHGDGGTPLACEFFRDRERE